MNQWVKAVLLTTVGKEVLVHGPFFFRNIKQILLLTKMKKKYGDLLSPELVKAIITNWDNGYLCVVDLDGIEGTISWGNGEILWTIDLEA